MGRHWVVVALGVVLALGAAVMTYARTEPLYEAAGSSIIVPATAVVDEASQRVIENPYGGGRDLLSAAQLAGEIARGDKVGQYVFTHGGNAAYEVEVSPQAPILSVTATGPDLPGTLQTVKALLEGLAAELEGRQTAAGVPAQAQIKLDVVAVPQQALPVNASRVKSTALIAFLGMVAAVSLAFLFEAMQISRANRRHDASGAHDVPTSFGQRRGPDSYRPDPGGVGRPAASAPPVAGRSPLTDRGGPAWSSRR